MFKRVKISDETHAILKAYCKQKGRTMKWVLENYIKTECNTGNKGVRLNVDGSKKHV